MIDVPKSWTGRQIMLEGFDFSWRAFGKRFHPTVGQVLHVADDLMTSRGTLRKETITNSLHIATDEEPARDPRHWIRFQI